MVSKQVPIRGDLHIYHFLFTDDTILFCDASREQDNNKTTQKDYTGIKLLTHPATSHCLQRSDDFIPTKQSTLSTLESNSKCSNYASQATNANKNNPATNPSITQCILFFFIGNTRTIINEKK